MCHSGYIRPCLLTSSSHNKLLVHSSELLQLFVGECVCGGVINPEFDLLGPIHRCPSKLCLCTPMVDFGGALGPQVAGIALQAQTLLGLFSIYKPP